jgi:hypothetical protein
MWSVVMWSELTWLMWRDFVLKLNEVKWVPLKFFGTKVLCTLGWPYTEGTWLYCDCFIWCVSCTVVVLTCFVMCGCVCMWFCNVWGCVRMVCVGFVMCGCFGNVCTCIYCVSNCLYRVFVFFLLCIFILICFVCTGVRITATEWKLNCSK